MKYKTGAEVVAAVLNELEYGYGVKELESYGRPTCEEIAEKISVIGVIPDLVKTVEQYKRDVETRIKCIAEDRDNNEATWHDPDTHNDYQQQIAHWDATLKQINKVLERIK